MDPCTYCRRSIPIPSIFKIGETMAQETPREATDYKPKRSRRRKVLMIGGVAAAIALVASIGFWVWHEQPTFCNSICHQPMDAYVQTFYEESDLMAYAHQIEQVNCLDCHEAKIDEQLHEARVWFAGAYAMQENGLLANVGVRSDANMCATPDCHIFDHVVSVTENWGGVEGANPHDSHLGYAIDCSNCHGAHESSYLYCNTCHDYKVPDGWESPRPASV